MSELKVMCTDVNCPERTGGECQLNREYTEEEKKQILLDAARYLTEDVKSLDPDIAKLVNDNFMDLLM